MQPIPYEAVKLQNNPEMQAYPVNYGQENNYQVPVGQPYPPYQNPQQYPYSYPQSNPQMNQQQTYSPQMVNPQMINPQQIVIIGYKNIFLSPS